MQKKFKMANLFITIKNNIALINRKVKDIDLTSILSTENIFANTPYIFLLFLLAIIYIGNTHLVEKTVRQINKMNVELKEVRWQYMSSKADLMFKSKQTEVAKSVEALGLKELRNPPQKIIVSKNEY